MASRLRWRFTLAACALSALAAVLAGCGSIVTPTIAVTGYIVPANFPLPDDSLYWARIHLHNLEDSTPGQFDGATVSVNGVACYTGPFGEDCFGCYDLALAAGQAVEISISHPSFG